jgi:hypothetical protein
MINCLSILNLFVLVWKLLLKILTLQNNSNILKPRFYLFIIREKVSFYSQSIYLVYMS